MVEHEPNCRFLYKLVFLYDDYLEVRKQREPRREANWGRWITFSISGGLAASAFLANMYGTGTRGVVELALAALITMCIALNTTGESDGRARRT